MFRGCGSSVEAGEAFYHAIVEILPSLTAETVVVVRAVAISFQAARAIARCVDQSSVIILSYFYCFLNARSGVVPVPAQ